jgi:hypothetical protein
MKYLTEKKNKISFQVIAHLSILGISFFFIKQNSTFIEAIKKTRTKKKKYLFITIAVYCQIVNFQFQLCFFSKRPNKRKTTSRQMR